MVIGLFKVILLARACKGVVRGIFVWSRLFFMKIEFPPQALSPPVKI